MKSHRLLDGSMVALGELTATEKGFLKTLGKMSKAGINYFDIYRFALGPSSPALQGRSRVDKVLVATPLYRVAEDIATRAGVAQGLILAPEHETKRVLASDLKEPLSVPQAADLIGISRIAAYKAIKEGRLAHVKIGNVLLIKRADAEAYKRSKESIRRGITRSIATRTTLSGT